MMSGGPAAAVPPSGEMRRDFSLSNMKKVDQLGHGAFGEVYLYYHPGSRHTVAVKTINLNPRMTHLEKQMVAALREEIWIMSQLDHRHIVKYLGCDVDDRESSLAIIMEFVQGGSLSFQLKHDGPLTPQTTWTYTGQILQGLAYIHSKNIMHRDLKAANILCDKMTGVIKLCDFGIAKQQDSFLSTIAASTYIGTPNWMAPEVLLIETLDQQKYDRKVDIWSVGCTAIEMLTGKVPWHGLSHIAITDHMRRHKSPLEQAKVKLTRQMMTLQELCLNYDPQQRPSAEELLHQFFGPPTKPLSLIGITDQPNRAVGGDATEVNKAPGGAAEEDPGQEHLVLLGGTGETDGGRWNTRIWDFNCKTKTWDEWGKVPVTSGAYSVCVIDGGIVLSGGGKSGKRQLSCDATVWKLDLATDVWYELGHMTTGRSYHGSVYHRDDLYMIGGVDASRSSLSSVEVFSISSWKQKGILNMPRPLVSPMVVTDGDNKIYIMGGVSGMKHSDNTRHKLKEYKTVYVFNSDDNSWQPLSDMPHYDRGGAIVWHLGQIFVVGGRDRICQSYQPTTDTWIVLSGPRLPHEEIQSAAVWNGRIVVGGGWENKANVTSSIEEYNPETDTWEMWNIELPKKLIGHYLLNISIK